MSEVSQRRTKMGSKSRGIDGSVERAIGSRLRAYYDEVAREPIPERFVDLLKRLDTDKSKN
jgi:Anti-sigma factor NepR